MFQEENRKNAYVTVWFLFGILLCFTLMDMILRFVMEPDGSGKIADVRPKLTIENVGDGRFAASYSRYVDRHFAGRDNLASAINYVEVMLNKRVIQDVYVTEDGYYIQQHLPTHYTKELMDEKLAEFKAFLEDYDDARLLLIPTQDSVMREKLPWSAPYVDEEMLLDRVEAHLGKDHVIGVFETFRKYREKELYLATDSRINTIGAYYTYRCWAESGNNRPIWYQLDNMTTVTQDYVGGLVQKVGYSDKKEELQVFTQTLEEPVIVTYDYEKVSGSFYEPEKLKGEDPYDYFLGGEHRLTVIDTQNDNGKVLFVIKDKNANAVIPLIAPHYARIYAVDMNDFSSDMKEFVDSCNIYGKMDVLLLCGISEFMDDFTY